MGLKSARVVYAFEFSVASHVDRYFRFKLSSFHLFSHVAIHRVVEAQVANTVFSTWDGMGSSRWRDTAHLRLSVDANVIPEADTPH